MDQTPDTSLEPQVWALGRKGPHLPNSSGRGRPSPEESEGSALVYAGRVAGVPQQSCLTWLQDCWVLTGSGIEAELGRKARQALLARGGEPCSESRLFRQDPGSTARPSTPALSQTGQLGFGEEVPSWPSSQSCEIGKLEGLLFRKSPLLLLLS